MLENTKNSQRIERQRKKERKKESVYVGECVCCDVNRMSSQFLVILFFFTSLMKCCADAFRFAGLFEKMRVKRIVCCQDPVNNTYLFQFLVLFVCEFKLQSRCYIYFRTNILGKGMKPLISQLWVK